MSVRLTMATQTVVLTLLDHAVDTETEVYGLEICHTAGLKGGVVYPILHRLERAGWLSSRLGAPGDSGGQRRRYYRFTRDGRRQARQRLGINTKDAS